MAGVFLAQQAMAQPPQQRFFPLTRAEHPQNKKMEAKFFPLQRQGGMPLKFVPSKKKPVRPGAGPLPPAPDIQQSPQAMTPLAPAAASQLLSIYAPVD